jgi:peptide/nickel transport system substrate-binding protein
MRSRSIKRVVVAATALALVGVACTNGGGNNGGGGSASSAGAGKSGGSIVLGAEQWPQCLNPVTDCASASWYLYTIQEHIFPRLMQWSNKFVAEPSPLITETPSESNGGITQSPFTVTYHLNPKAVWSDGTAITCADVDFTWKAIDNTPGTYSTAGYTTAGGVAGISKIECSDPQTVKIDFNNVYLDWPELFGGATGFILEKAAFPTADPKKPNLSQEMNNSISFSGGPWMLKSWSKDQAVLVRNTKYWGTQTLLDQVTFVPRTDPAKEVASLLSGDVDAIFPSPPNGSFAAQFGTDANVKTVGGDSNGVDGLWIQMDKPPMNDPKVRQAFAYAMDREAVIKNVISLNNPSAKVNNCGAWIPGQGPWCADPGSFAKYTYDATKVSSILTSDGYKMDASTGLFEKGGKALTITISTQAGNTRDAKTLSLLRAQALAAGIAMPSRAYPATDLFSNVLPKGDFQVALYQSFGIGFIDPSVTAIFSSDQIGGINWDHWSNSQGDALMQKSDQELDTTKRAALIQQIAALSAEDLPMVPLAVLPNVAAWRTDKIGGVDPNDVSSPYGFFFAMDTWYVP